MTEKHTLNQVLYPTTQRCNAFSLSTNGALKSARQKPEIQKELNATTRPLLLHKNINHRAPAPPLSINSSEKETPAKNDTNFKLQLNFASELEVPLKTDVCACSRNAPRATQSTHATGGASFRFILADAQLAKMQWVSWQGENSHQCSRNMV